MKIFVLLLLVGVASASFLNILDDVTEEMVHSFMEGMEPDLSLKKYLGEPDNENAERVEDETTKTELEKQLKETLNRLLERIKDAIEHGKGVKETFIAEIKDLRDKIKNLNIDLGENTKVLLEKIKEKVREYLKNLLENLGLNKRSADDQFEEAFSDLNFRDLFRKVKEHLRNNIDTEALKEEIEKIFGQGSELMGQLLQTLKEKSKKKLTILIDMLLGDDDDNDADNRESRFVKSIWERVRDYFKDLKIDLQEKYSKFGEWVKNAFEKGFEKSKDKIANIKAIAIEFIKHAGGASKEVASEAREFFKQYKEDLGNIWEEVKDKVSEIMKKEE